VYRIVQEGLTNAIRHAGAKHVMISVHEAAGAVHACVSDDGRGFDPAAPDEGFGLTGMRERVSLLRGDLEVTSSSDGTTIAAAIPAP
jgi:two-component system sensor histidine kinase UhpB